MVKKVGIIGSEGWVGKAMKSVFPDAVCFDPILEGSKIEDTNKCDIVFICVPTPNREDGTLDTSIVEESVKNCYASMLVIRSTVNPGDCQYWEGKYDVNICMQPEYLGETVAHPLLDESDRPFLVIGGRPECRRRLIELYHEVYNANINIRQVSLMEAEVIKLSENRAIAYKVAQCQELYDACEKNGVDYYTVRDAVYGDDPRFNLWFTFIYPDKRGFRSKCIPKDIYAWSAWAGKPELMESLLAYNNKLLKGNDADINNSI